MYHILSSKSISIMMKIGSKKTNKFSTYIKTWNLLFKNITGSGYSKIFKFGFV